MSYVSNLESNPNSTTESTSAAATTKPKLPVTLSTLNKLKANGETFSCLTCYDASFAAAMQVAGIDTILIGDSLGMWCKDKPQPCRWQSQTWCIIPKTWLVPTVMHWFYVIYLYERCHAWARTRCQWSGDANRRMWSKSKAVPSLPKLCQCLPTTACRPVHLGLTPQSVNVFGGYKVQGKTDTKRKNSWLTVKPW